VLAEIKIPKDRISSDKPLHDSPMPCLLGTVARDAGRGSANEEGGGAKKLRKKKKTLWAVLNFWYTSPLANTSSQFPRATSPCGLQTVGMRRGNRGWRWREDLEVSVCWRGSGIGKTGSLVRNPYMTAACPACLELLFVMRGGRGSRVTSTRSRVIMVQKKEIYRSPLLGME